MASHDLHEAEDGLGVRLAADGTLGTLVGTDESGSVRVYGAWPEEVLSEPRADEFPRITFFRASDELVRPGLGTVRLQCDIWVWPDGDEGGVLRLRQIRERAFELVDEQRWPHAGAQLDGIVLPGGSERPGRPLRYTFDVEIGVS